MGSERELQCVCQVPRVGVKGSGMRDKQNMRGPDSDRIIE